MQILHTLLPSLFLSLFMGGALLDAGPYPIVFGVIGMFVSYLSLIYRIPRRFCESYLVRLLVFLPVIVGLGSVLFSMFNR